MLRHGDAVLEAADTPIEDSFLEGRWPDCCVFEREVCDRMERLGDDGLEAWG